MSSLKNFATLENNNWFETKEKHFKKNNINQEEIKEAKNILEKVESEETLNLLIKHNLLKGAKNNI